MRSYLKIKGNYLWKICAIVIMGVVLTFCRTEINTVTQPATATVNTTVPITLAFTFHSNETVNANIILAILVPNGWDVANQPGLKVSYDADLGKGNMRLIDPTEVEKQSQLPWAIALKNKFHIAGNYVDDMQWVVFKSETNYVFNNTSTTGTINIQLPVGADNSNTNVRLDYVLSETNDGLASTDQNQDGGSLGEYWCENRNADACFMVTGGIGDIVDFCDPIIAGPIPAKPATDDFVTFSYFSNVLNAGLPSGSDGGVYLRITANLTDGTKDVAPVVSTDKLLMTETSPGSGVFSRTIWPRQFFGLSATQTISSVSYVITNSQGLTATKNTTPPAGTIIIGKGGNPTIPFVTTFPCN